MEYTVRKIQLEGGRCTGGCVLERWAICRARTEAAHL